MQPLRWLPIYAVLVIVLSNAAFAQVDRSLDNSVATTAAKEKLHRSLALPGSYEEVERARNVERPDAITNQHELNSQKPQEPAPISTGSVNEPSAITVVVAPAVAAEGAEPCDHPEHLHVMGDVFGDIVSDASREVFGVEQIISSRMHDMFEDLLSAPTIPSMLDMLQAGPVSAAPLFSIPMPTFKMPSFTSTRVSVPAQPVYDMVISSTSSRRNSDKTAEPTWEQEVVISSSDPVRLQELAGMFEQQLPSGHSRKLKSISQPVRSADAAQVLLLAARKLQSAGLLPVRRQ